MRIRIALLAAAFAVVVAGCSPSAPAPQHPAKAKPTPSRQAVSLFPEDDGDATTTGDPTSDWHRIEPSDDPTLMRSIAIRSVPASGAPEPGDDWARLSADGSLPRALDRQLPRFAEIYGVDGHLTFAYTILGAKETTTGAELSCACTYASWRAPAWGVGLDASTNEMLIVVRRSRSGWRITAGWTVKDGVPGSSTSPTWADERLDDDAQRAAVNQMGLAWVVPRLPKDRLVAMAPDLVSDPHHHQPMIDALRMLNPKYQPMSITRFGPMKPSYIRGDLGGPWSSADGRFTLHYGDPDHFYLLLADHKTQTAYDLTASTGGIDDSEGAAGAPVFVGHILVVDFVQNVSDDDSELSTIHYEIDCDTMKVLRAVPIGAWSLNPLVR